MAEPNSKATFKQYIKRALGAPVIEINIDEDQLDDRVDEALQYFREYHYDGSIKTYLKHQLSANDIAGLKTDESFTENAAGTHAKTDQQYKQQQNYIVLPEFILSVLNIFPFADKHNLNMFDIRYQLRLNDIYDLTNTSILYYEMVQQHISMLDQILVGQTPIRYNTHMNRLYLDMDADQINAGEFIIIECYRKLDPDSYTDIYDDIYLKRYATSLIKKQWGANLSKFSGVAMLGGVTMNGETIYSQAIEEQNKLEEEIQMAFELPINYMIG